MKSGGQEADESSRRLSLYQWRKRAHSRLFDESPMKRAMNLFKAAWDEEMPDAWRIWIRGRLTRPPAPKQGARISSAIE